MTGEPPLEEAFTGYFTDHHAFLLSKMLARVDQINADVAELDAKIEAEIAPFARAVERLDEIQVDAARRLLEVLHDPSPRASVLMIACEMCRAKVSEPCGDGLRP